MWELIRVTDRKKWLRSLDACGRYDTYHLPRYHELAQTMGEGDAYLFVFGSGSHHAAFPFLLNCLDKLAGLEYCRHTDATSVYGYPGAITTIHPDDFHADEFRRAFQRELLVCLREMGVVTLFSRQNPLLDTSWLFHGIGNVQALSQTVSIDLAKPEEWILGDMRENHRYRIRRALRRGVSVADDVRFEHLSDFISMYTETMDRHNAGDSYYFPAEYFHRLRDTMTGSLKLFHAYLNGAIVSSFLFFTTRDIVQYHLSGTPSDCLQHDGPRVVLYQAALWARQAGFRWLHLGGGVGASEDSLFNFKAGFSPVRHRFELVRMVVNEQVYNDLVSRRTPVQLHRSVVAKTKTFFPSYRHPVLPR